MSWEEMNRMFREMNRHREIFREVERATEAAKPAADALDAFRRDLDGPVGRALRDLNSGPVAQALRDIDRLRNW